MDTFQTEADLCEDFAVTTQSRTRNIVLLSDGTGNSAAQVWKTNVWRIYQAIDVRDRNQIAYYNDGVGTSSFRPLAMLGGAFGWGLKRNVLELYCFLCRTYADRNDKIYAFGFSRGAYTIRILADLIVHQGIVDYESEADLQRRARDVYRKYRAKFYPISATNERTLGFIPAISLIIFVSVRAIRDAAIFVWRKLRGQPTYRQFKRKKTTIEFLGLWDTVAAYGLPIEEMTRGVDYWFFPLSLPNRKLSKRVLRACHALSLDDARTTFHPMLWTEKQERVYPGKCGVHDATPIARTWEERLSQVWFCGVHANVGGGYPDDSLAYVPLDWIMDE
ncbi:MAG: hypothetical protein QOH67_2787, partial [Hyphomicrobiales bacterium]|nr:hypothetical protein [Hyphomicrobiales bacterium]